jgi:hypothetical protein
VAQISWGLWSLHMTQAWRQKEWGHIPPSGGGGGRGKKPVLLAISKLKCLWLFTKAFRRNKDMTPFVADSFQKQNIMKRLFLLLQRKSLQPRDRGCIQEQRGCLQGPAICLPAVKGIGEDKRYFPSCSTEKPICYPARAQCRGNPSSTKAFLPEFPANAPQTIPPTLQSHTPSQPAFLNFSFLLFHRAKQRQHLWFKTSRRVCLQCCQNFLLLLLF